MLPSLLKKGRFLANETTGFSSSELTKLTFFYFGHNPGWDSTLGFHTGYPETDYPTLATDTGYR